MGKSLPADPPRLDPDRSALFLDYDGTLVGIAPTPAEAHADAGLVSLLGALERRLGGALAIVSGRPVADIDGFLAPLRLNVAGLHGLQLRRRDGSLVERAAAAAPLEAAKIAFNAFAGQAPGTLVEDKRLSVALHFRGAPTMGDAATALASRLAAASGGELRLQQGKMVVELLPAGRDKGRAIEDLLALPEFAHRHPVFVGDDITDEAGFRVVNERGGTSVRVGTAEQDSAAAWRLAGIDALRRWLDDALADAPSG
jgi:trehalose 6-phosphate phosphatase